jgi:hypothetical protein
MKDWFEGSLLDVRQYLTNKFPCQLRKSCIFSTTLVAKTVSQSDKTQEQGKRLIF